MIMKIFFYMVNVDQIFYKYPDIIQLCSLSGCCKCCSVQHIEFSASTFPRERGKEVLDLNWVMQILINRC